jgi:type II secretory pathway pseudopilin PulG
MSSNPYESPDTVGESPVRATRTWRRTLIELLAVVGVVGILIALLLPNVRTAGEAARRMQCSNNLKQIALALRSYEDVYHALPPAYTVDAEGRPLHSWRTLILPYMEQQPLYEKIDLAKPWDDPANQAAYETAIDAYRCPSVNCSPNHTTYLAVVARNGCFRPAEPRKRSEITDDHSSTLMVIEAPSDRHVHWMSPTDADERLILDFGPASKLPHPGGVQAALVDGSVRFLNSELDVERRRALISIDGGDDAVAQVVE